jgi:hypothetical protein
MTARRRSIERVPGIVMLPSPTIFGIVRPPRNSHGLTDAMSEALPEVRSFLLPAGIPHRTPLSISHSDGRPCRDHESSETHVHRGSKLVRSECSSVWSEFVFVMARMSILLIRVEWKKLSTSIGLTRNGQNVNL